AAHQLLEVDELLAADGDAAAPESLLGGTSRGCLCHRATRRECRRHHRRRGPPREPTSPGRLICSIKRPAEDPARLRECQRARCELVLVAAPALHDDSRDRIAPGLARRDEE